MTNSYKSSLPSRMFMTMLPQDITLPYRVQEKGIMKPALVKGRNEGKQVRRCVACGACAHRLDTCGSRAGKEIQKLRRELKGLRFHPGIRKQPGRDGRKDKCHKTVAQLQYSGKADRYVHDALDRPSGGGVETI